MNGQEFNRYRAMLSPLISTALRAAMCDTKSDRVTLGIPAARLIIEDDSIFYSDLVKGFQTLSTLGGNDAPMLADSYGHRRDVYHLLVLHLHLVAFAKHFESMSVSQWSACENALPAATQSARHIEVFASQPPDAEHVSATLWRALCLFETASLQSRDTDIEWVDAVVHQIVENPGKDGSLHPIEADESFDLWTYRELSGLHALANLALRLRNQAWAKRVQDIAEYHQAKTQPDYTTSQPWGVFAFLWPTSTRLFADQQIHDAQTEGGGSLTPLAAMLLADAANSLATFTDD